MTATKVKLRKRTLPSGKITLYLDFYPPVRNPKTLELCKGFREYLLTAKLIKNQKKDLNQNSASGYWSTFRALLAIAYREHLIKENINEYLEGISDVETRREYLTLEELRDLAATPCEISVLKAASLFSCLTGLRISDILALRWDNVEQYPDGGACLRLKTEKTDTETTLPIYAEALELCGKRGKGLVFKGLDRQMTRQPLKDWLEDADIGKHITFHCFRHTNATLLLDSGTDIYTVSKMLTHRNVATTQIYTEVMDKNKRKAAESLTIKKK